MKITDLTLRSEASPRGNWFFVQLHTDANERVGEASQAATMRSLSAALMG